MAEYLKPEFSWLDINASDRYAYMGGAMFANGSVAPLSDSQALIRNLSTIPGLTIYLVHGGQQTDRQKFMQDLIFDKYSSYIMQHSSPQMGITLLFNEMTPAVAAIEHNWNILEQLAFHRYADSEWLDIQVSEVSAIQQGGIIDWLLKLLLGSLSFQDRHGQRPAHCPCRPQKITTYD